MPDPVTDITEGEDEAVDAVHAAAASCLRARTPDGKVGHLDDYIFDGPGSLVAWGPSERTYVVDRYDADENVWVLRDETRDEVMARVAEIERKAGRA
jgi:hypothetical protein